MIYFIFLLSLFFIFLEATFFSFPFVLVLLLNLVIFHQRAWILPLSFFLGLILDILLMQKIGLSSLFFTLFLSLIFIYRKKFEIQTPEFVIVAGFISSLFYGMLIGQKHIFLGALFATLVGVGMFFIFKKNFRLFQI